MLSSFSIRPLCLYHTALQSQKAVTAYLKSEQLLPFGFARRHRSHMSWLPGIFEAEY